MHYHTILIGRVQMKASHDPVAHLSLDWLGARGGIGVGEDKGIGDVAADG